jgi:hypothetical protein
MTARPQPRFTAPIIPLSTLDAFNDLTILRDPRGRSFLPSLVPCDGGEGPALQAVGPFLIHQVYRVTRDEGIRFVDATGDENPIHREGDVIPGAMTGAKGLASLEILFPRLAVRGARFKFRGIGRYDKPLRNQLSWRPGEDGTVSVDVRTTCEGRLIAEGIVTGEILAEPPAVNVRPRRTVRAQAQKIESFLDAMRIEPGAFLTRDGKPYLAYPRAFLLSLPSGEMVRRFEGSGGILSVLDLEFSDAAPIPLEGGRLLEVVLDWKRAGRSFSKIVTCIRDGIQERCRGFALVLAPGAARR